VKQSIDASGLTRLRRRQFLSLSGAISALAGIGCSIRRPVEKIMPYTEMPEDVTVGVPSHYASVLTRRGEALGVVVQSTEGRPTKVEGNPEHPASSGGTDLQAQAILLELYDSERARRPTQQGAPKTWADVDAALAELAGKLAESGGAGLRVLCEPTLSPTFLRLRAALKAKLPSAVFHTYAPVSDSNERAGTQLAFGRPLLVQHWLTKAQVIVALDSDFLMTETGSVEAARGFATGRHMESASAKAPNRLYVVEPTLSVTGSNADHRLSLPARSIGAYARALAAGLGAHASRSVRSAVRSRVLSAARSCPVSASMDRGRRQDLAEHKGTSLVIAGSRQPPAVHALVHAMNAALGNVSRTVVYVTPVDAEEPHHFIDIAALARDMAAGKVQTLLVLGGNPVLDAPADVQFKEALAKVPLSICLSGYRHETGELCTWHVPQAHPLESWGDQISRIGAYSVQQPLIAPLYKGPTDTSLLAALGADTERDPHLLVKATAAAHGVEDDERRWLRLLQRGVGPRNESEIILVVLSLRLRDRSPQSRRLPRGWGSSATTTLEVCSSLTTNCSTGPTLPNNVWLQELPIRSRASTWDNARCSRPAPPRRSASRAATWLRLSLERGLDRYRGLGAARARRRLDRAAAGLGAQAAAGSTRSVRAFDCLSPGARATPRTLSPALKLTKLGTRYPAPQTPGARP
jgi:molybdopterin-containing oxidoreductase family iron-sulfur binding subunit